MADGTRRRNGGLPVDFGEIVLEKFRGLEQRLDKLVEAVHGGGEGPSLSMQVGLLQQKIVQIEDNAKHIRDLQEYARQTDEKRRRDLIRLSLSITLALLALFKDALFTLIHKVGP